MNAKQVTMTTLAQLKQELYRRAAIAQSENPKAAERIQKRVDADARHLAFAINMVNIKF